ncbi:Retrovirus-related Pol polyprotein from transposon TNT 1-94 [Porphyridium purpureum]|uniref:Retrovirus-related Pol polyprotein from transposon TNT 1-94 n=1 Tax=Porphyridium purpureum TaxID=35688 RepID=A0A5J4YR09_PORPP|nr:Retrovirus-related Pol polyprotein from transposon TNT 1-94 [Porphyridium purpureum]|eukprot:POR7040..scf296_7
MTYKGGFGIRKLSSLGKATTRTMAFVYAHTPIHNPVSQVKSPAPFTLRGDCGNYATNERLADEGLHLLHSDLLAVTPSGLRGEKYLVSLVDDYSGLGMVTAIHNKTETQKALSSMLEAMEQKCGRTARVLRTDRGTEFRSANITTWAAGRPLALEPSPACCPEMNGRAERFNRTILERLRAVVDDAEIPKCWWPELAPAIAHVLNRTKNARGKIPVQAAYNGSTDVSHLRSLGAIAYVYARGKDKLDARAVKGRLVGYGTRPKVYRIITAEDAVIETTNVRVVEGGSLPSANESELFDVTSVGHDEEGVDDLACTRPSPIPHATAHVEGGSEQELIITGTSGQPSEEVSECPDSRASHTPTTTIEMRQEESANEGPAIEEETRIRTSGRVKRIPARYRSDTALLTQLLPVSSHATAEGQKAIDKEVSTLVKLGAWDPSNVMERRDAASRFGDAIYVRGKVILSLKHAEEPERAKLKARVVAQGCVLRNGEGAKVCGGDFPLEKAVSLSSFRTALAIATASGLDVAFFDITAAYLISRLGGPRTFISLPPEACPSAWESYDDPVVELLGALYGMPRSGADYGMEARKRLVHAGWRATENDMNLYVKSTGQDRMTLSLYVDDGMLIGRTEIIEKELQCLRRIFPIHEHVSFLSNGEAQFLGHRISRSEGVVSIDKTRYAEHVIKAFEAREGQVVRTCKTPASPTGKSTTAPPVSQLTDQLDVVGQLLWLSITTRPDISQATRQVAERAARWDATADDMLEHIIGYLRAKTQSRIQYGTLTGQGKGSGAQVVLFADADHAGCPITARSTSGWCAFLVEGTQRWLVDWSSRKQRCAASSTTEAEVVALADGVDRGLIPLCDAVEAITGSAPQAAVLVDSEAAEAAVKKGYSSRLTAVSKYHGIRLSRWHDFFQGERTALWRVASHANPADMFTKALSADVLCRHARSLQRSDEFINEHECWKAAHRALMSPTMLQDAKHRQTQLYSPGEDQEMTFEQALVAPREEGACEENFEILATSSTMTRGGATIVPAMTRGVVSNGGAKVTTGMRSGPPRARAVRASARLGPGARGRDIKEMPVSLSWCLSRLGGRDE